MVKKVNHFKYWKYDILNGLLKANLTIYSKKNGYKSKISYVFLIDNDTP